MNSLGNTKQTDPLGPMRHRSHTGLCEGEGGGKNEVIICLTCSTCVHCHLLNCLALHLRPGDCVFSCREGSICLRRKFHRKI